MTARWLDVVAQGRAVALADLDVRPGGPLAAGYAGPGQDLFEFLLGLRPALAVPDGPVRDRLAGITRALDFRLAAQIHWLSGVDGPVAVNLPAARWALRTGATPASVDAVHDAVRAHDTRPLTAAERPATDDELRLLDGAAPAGRLRLAPRPPVLVLSSAGRPADVHAGLAGYLAVLRAYHHGDLTVVLADDAPDAGTARALEHIAADAVSRYGIAVHRFAEWTGDGRPGGKQHHRQKLIANLPAGTDADVVSRILAPGLPGTANCVFTRFAGRDTIWLEEDACAFAVDRGEPVERSQRVDATLRVSGIADTMADGTVDGAGDPPATRHPVDIPHIVDRLLHATAVEAAAFDRQIPSYEDAGFEEFAGASPGPAAPAGMVHFQTCGQPDFRARLSHRYALADATPAGERDAFLGGGLPVRRSFAAAPPTVAVRRWTSAFGTAVGFAGGLLARPPTMWATKIRLVDFAVGQLARARGVSACVAGTALEHRRGEVTDSGRGELVPYLRNEELLWPLLHRAGAVLAGVPGPGDYVGWLRAAGAAMADAGATGRIVPPALAHALWAEAREDVRRAGRSPVPAVRGYGRRLAAGLAACAHENWFDYHAWLDRSAGGELRAYGEQLSAWAGVVAQLPSQAVEETW